jgi:hypothetical protein
MNSVVIREMTMRSSMLLGLAFLVGCARPGPATLAVPVPGGLNDSAAAKALFAAPTREYATAPLWVWNDLLTEDQIRGTMRDLAGQKVKQVFVHPRPGLMTPYLSADWFRLWKVALDEAEKLDMNVWIYDENSYPSGFAGGHVPELMPESRGRGGGRPGGAPPPPPRPRPGPARAHIPALLPVWASLSENRPDRTPW